MRLFTFDIKWQGLTEQAPADHVGYCASKKHFRL